MINQAFALFIILPIPTIAYCPQADTNCNAIGMCLSLYSVTALFVSYIALLQCISKKDAMFTSVQTTSRVLFFLLFTITGIFHIRFFLCCDYHVPRNTLLAQYVAVGCFLVCLFVCVYMPRVCPLVKLYHLLYERSSEPAKQSMELCIPPEVHHPIQNSLPNIFKPLETIQSVSSLLPPDQQTLHRQHSSSPRAVQEEENEIKREPITRHLRVHITHEDRTDTLYSINMLSDMPNILASTRDRHDKKNVNTENAKQPTIAAPLYNVPVNSLTNNTSRNADQEKNQFEEVYQPSITDHDRSQHTNKKHKRTTEQHPRIHTADGLMDTCNVRSTTYHDSYRSKKIRNNLNETINVHQNGGEKKCMTTFIHVK
jgi:hypothetical protein